METIFNGDLEESQPEDAAVGRLLIEIQNRTNTLQNWYRYADNRITEITEGYNFAAKMSVEILVDNENKIRKAAFAAEQSGQEVQRLVQALEEMKNTSTECVQSIKTVQIEIGQVVQQGKIELAKNVKRDEFCGLVRGGASGTPLTLNQMKDLENRNRAALKDLYNRMQSTKQQNQLAVCQIQQLSAEIVNTRTQTSSCNTKIKEIVAEIQRIFVEVSPMVQEIDVCRQREAKIVQDQKAKLLPLQVALYKQDAKLTACQQSSTFEALELSRLQSTMNLSYRQAIAHDDEKKSVTKELKDAFTKDFAPDKCAQNRRPNDILLFDLVSKYPQLSRTINFFNKPRPPFLPASAEFNELEQKDPVKAAQYKEEAQKIQNECGQLWQYGRKIDSIVRAELAAGR